MKIKVLCILLSLGAVSMAFAKSPASSLTPVQVAVGGEDDAEEEPEEAPSCLEQCEIQEEWCAADCIELTDECPLSEAGELSDCVTPKAACEQSCSEALAACQQSCEAE